MAAAFVQCLARVEGAVAAASGSRDVAKAEAFAGRAGIPKACASYEALAADPDIDVVYIATVNATHAPLCLRSLEAGKAVLCEKPFAMNAAEARTVVELARRRGLFCMEAMWTRFVPAVVRLKQLLDEGTIGASRLFSAHLCFAFRPETAGRVFDPALGGGALLDLGVYPISLASFLFGPPEPALGRAVRADSGVDAAEAIVLSHPRTGALSTLAASITAVAPNDALVMGSRGWIRVHEPIFRPDRLTVHTAEPREIGVGGGQGRGELTTLVTEPCEGNGYHYQAGEVVRCLRAGLTESPIMPLDETIAILDVMDGLRRAWGVRFPGEA
jgi:predicted dehydrogenase